MTRALCLFATTACLAASPAAQAHPHIFVSAELTVVFGGAVPTGVEVTWIYDDFFSLLITSDLGIDNDGDLVLTADEKAVLAAAVTEWPADFEGDLVVSQNGTDLPLAPRQSHRMEFIDGLVHEVHVRPVSGGADAPIQIAVYDPFYYVAYDVTQVRITGRDDCKAAIVRADLAAANKMVEEMIGRPAAEVGPDEVMPRVGHAFADRITVTCGSGA